MGIVFASMIVFVYVFIQCFTVKLLPPCVVIRKEINKVGIVFVFMIVFVQFVAVVGVFTQCIRDQFSIATARRSIVARRMQL